MHEIAAAMHPSLVHVVSPHDPPADDDVLAGLRAPRKRLPARLLRDDAGAALREDVTRLPDHYPSRVEQALVRAHVGPIAHHVGAAARVVDVGCGEGAVARVLLRALTTPASYAPVDLAPAQLGRLAADLRARAPGLAIEPVTADVTQPFELPAVTGAAGRTLVVVPHDLIGALEPAAARALLARLATLAGDTGLLLLGADATRDPERLLRAHDDPHGVTEAYCRHALVHVNGTHGATFDPHAFTHRAAWSAPGARVEHQLVSRERQIVRVDGQAIGIAPGEIITVLHQLQHTPEALGLLLASGGWRPRQVFTSAEVPFRLWLCERTRWAS